MLMVLLSFLSCLLISIDLVFKPERSCEMSDGPFISGLCAGVLRFASWGPKFSNVSEMLIPSSIPRAAFISGRLDGGGLRWLRTLQSAAGLRLVLAGGFLGRIGAWLAGLCEEPPTADAKGATCDIDFFPLGSPEEALESVRRALIAIAKDCESTETGMFLQIARVLHV